MQSKNITKYFFIFLLVLLLGYAAYTARHILLGPVIRLNSNLVQNDVIVATSRTLNIYGTVLNTTELRLNKHRLILNFTDKSFAERVLLSNGANVYILDATDKFGRTSQKRLTVLYNSKNK
jgi:hypothetical protein